jgi:hypothetical protein
VIHGAVGGNACRNWMPSPLANRMWSQSRALKDSHLRAYCTTIVSETALLVEVDYVGRNNQGNEVDSCQEHGTVKQCAPLLTGPDFYDTP